MTDRMLEVNDLVVKFPLRGRRREATVIHGISFHIDRGETLSLVGESGSGKSTIGRAILGLAPVSDGSIAFDGEDIGGLSRAQRRSKVTGLQAIFQDPYSSLNPAMTVSDILTEPLLVRGVRGARARVADLLDAVHLPPDAGSRLASEFSGGQRQRIAIARAIALDPKLIVCDEPTSALDVSTQARVLSLLRELQERTGVAYLFISHDLGVVRHISDRIIVLRQGRVVETGNTEQVTTEPQEHYTRQLLLSTPVLDPRAQARRRVERQQLAGAHNQSRIRG